MDDKNNKEQKSNKGLSDNTKFTIVTVVFVIIIFILNYIRKFSNEEYTVKHVIPERIGK